MSAIIEIYDLWKRYGDVEAVKGISFTVQPGEVFGFLACALDIQIAGGLAAAGWRAASWGVQVVA